MWWRTVVRTDGGKTTENRSALGDLHRRARDEENAGASLSGHERNRLFLSRGGEEFVDASGISGLDNPADGRAFGILDYDRDGWLDIALVNSNAPWIELFRNQMGCHPAAGPGRGRTLAFRFVGGNDTAQPSSSWSARDGIGAVVTVDLGSRPLVREVRAGEGFAAQNSATLLVGIGEHERARKVTVRWPSGLLQEVLDVPEGTLLTVYENPERSPSGQAFVGEPNRRAVPSRPAPPRSRLGIPSGSRKGRLHLYTTMAAWCAACKVEIPKLRRLRSTFGEEDLAMFGVPIDPAESRELIEAWRAENQPPYELRSDLGPAEVARVRNLVLDDLKFDAVPATLLTDGDGHVLWIQWGPPSISKIRELLAGIDNEQKGNCQENP